MITTAPLRPADRARWLELWLAYQKFYEIALPAAVTDDLWERLQSERVRGLGARGPSNEIVGIVHFLFHEDTWSTTPACYLQDLYVDAAVRGSGYGRLLIQAVAAAAKAASANSPYWLTHETNAAGRRLYDRIGKNHGFIHYGYVDA